ncbi:hypothetical protein [Parachlamydia acanthamoebae]|uniref:Uncharacterized protein n=1 Tax=Parachlamydia acanthamoebae TaxID=83552 RepID=A0A0C1ECB1_9BACT|nr:hypothetical protein [Parachlamydia acanthamoebae]KIA78737.1 hypothetical protein DB43_DL00070 [Parachlamydia acanthamoebae]
MIQASPAFVNSERLELAGYLVEYESAPNIALRAIFDRAIKCLEIYLTRSLNLSLRENIWHSVSKERLTTLNQILAEAVNEKIFCQFTDSEIHAMLIECKQTGAVSCIRLAMETKHKENAIMTILVGKVNAMAKSLTCDMVDCFEKRLAVITSQ